MSTRVLSDVAQGGDDVVGGWRHQVRVWCGVVIAAVVLIPGLAPTFVNAWLETDPRVEGLPPTLGGMSGAMAVGVQLVGMVAALVGMVLSRGVRGWWLLLGCVGCVGAMICVMGTGAESVMDRVMVGSWVAGVVMALGVASLAGDGVSGDAVRRWVVAVLVAGLISMFADALWFVFVEHPEQVRYFEQNMDEMLRARGWVEGGPEHQLFVRRMMFSDATGAYALSNVFGSVAGALGCLGLGYAGLRWKYEGNLAALGVVLLGLVLVWLTASRGALAVMVLVLGWFGVVWWMGAGWRWRWVWGVAGLVLVLVPWAGVGWAGWVGPPSAEAVARDGAPGWLSLLFRYWYLEGGVRILMGGVGEGVSGFGRVWWWPLGPEGFSRWFMREHDPRLPEEVASTHNVVMDLLVMLGVWGLGWLVLGGCWLWRGLTAEVGEEEARVEGEPNWLAGLVVMGLVFGPVLWVIRGTLLPESALMWLLVFALSVVAVAWLAERRVMVWGLGAAALMLVVHGQLEMTFFNGGASQLAWVVLGLAGRSCAVSGLRWSVRRSVWGAVCGCCLIAVVSCWVWHAGRVVADEAHGYALARDLVAGDMSGVDRWLEGEAAYGASEEIGRWMVRLSLERVGGLAAAGRMDEARALAFRTKGRIEADLDGVGDAGWYRMQAGILEAVLHLEPEDREDVLAGVRDDYERVLTRAPYSVRDRVRLVEVLMELGQWDEAVEELERARVVNAGLYLDPAKQVVEEVFAGLSERIDAGRGR